MPDDPLVTALYFHRELRPFDLQAAIAYRHARIRDLYDEIRCLTALAEAFNAVLDIRAERDPPLEAPQRSHH